MREKDKNDAAYCRSIDVSFYVLIWLLECFKVARLASRDYGKLRIQLLISF